jgi:ketosteroid isomerase-like protein
MDNNTALVNDFYAAFAQRDFKRMNALYSNDIVFFDPVFQLLEGDQVKGMWEMLCNRAVDFSLTHEPAIALDDSYVTCAWTATYTFSATGRRVINKAKGHMKIVDGKIIEHSDGFSLHQWSRQALGFSGWLLGWNRFFQRSIQNKARKQLLSFLSKKNLDAK